jgi:hypothetical protein
VLAKYDFRIRVTHIDHDGPARWRNLISWLRLIHEDAWCVFKLTKLGSPLGTHEHSRRATSEEKEFALVAGLFLAVRSMWQMHWDGVEITLALLRYGLVQFDGEWDVD